MRLAITGADGFVGRAVCSALQHVAPEVSVQLFDKEFESQPAFRSTAIDLTHPDAAALVCANADCVIHLAAVPGAASEENPKASARLNLQFSLSLIEELRGKRLVYASSIAVFGDNFPAPGEPNTQPNPVSVYGTHKRMVELAFSDAMRRGKINGYALRLPGIVARPQASTAFGSSFLSEIFLNAFGGGETRIPVSPSAASLLCSSQVCAQNLAIAALTDRSSATPIAMPAVRAEMSQLIKTLASMGADTTYSFHPDPELERMFGAHPGIDNAAAEQEGFVSDGDIGSLARNVIESLKTAQLVSA